MVKRFYRISALYENHNVRCGQQNVFCYQRRICQHIYNIQNVLKTLVFIYICLSFYLYIYKSVLYLLLNVVAQRCSTCIMFIKQDETGLLTLGYQTKCHLPH